MLFDLASETFGLFADAMLRKIKLTANSPELTLSSLCPVTKIRLSTITFVAQRSELLSTSGVGCLA